MAELSITALRAGYGHDDTLHDITLHLAAGQLHAVLGPNGTGKTTLLRTVAGILPLRGGRIEWKDDGNRVALDKLAARERAGYVAYVPQLAGNDVPLSVREAIDIAGRSSQSTGLLSSGSRAPTLDLLNLTAYADMPCSALSGGLWRRVLLAQGLAQRAPILLLDEPIAFLDPPARSDTLRLLRQLAQTLGLCVVCVLHDPQLALEFAHTASAITDGRVLASGSAPQVINPTLLDLLYRGSRDLNFEPVKENLHAS